MSVSFDVEEAGCESCARIIASALSRVATVERVEIDAAADQAAAVLSTDAPPDAVDAALAEASAGAGHNYRVRAGSWRSGGGSPKAAPAGTKTASLVALGKPLE